MTSKLLFLAASSLLAQQNDWRIVSAQRLGPITAVTTRTDLDLLFGQQNVEDRSVDTGQGPEPVTVVFPHSPGAAAALVWDSLESPSRVRAIHICYLKLAGPCRWSTGSGVTLGTKLEKLEELNGRPFLIQAWGTDGGGTVSSWRGGRLENLLCEDWPTPAGLTLTLGWQPASGRPTPQQLKVLDEPGEPPGQLLSSDKAVRQVKLRVSHLAMTFAHASDNSATCR